MVHYPRLTPQGKIFEWFGKNRGRTVQKPAILNTIPIIGGGKKTLPADATVTPSPTPRA
ncbi:MAG: hypothetical protein LBU32_33255 [Clostridiales bacterium]|nr:hypothetical protein [Clostridiales bacterium]